MLSKNVFYKVTKLSDKAMFYLSIMGIEYDSDNFFDDALSFVKACSDFLRTNAASFDKDIFDSSLDGIDERWNLLNLEIASFFGEKELLNQYEQDDRAYLLSCLIGTEYKGNDKKDPLDIFMSGKVLKNG